MALEKLVKDFEKALERLEEAYLRARNSNESDYPFFRDSAIQRFEFTVEIFWKCIKTYLREKEGIECRSPKSCVREFFSLGYLTEGEAITFLKMIDDRNLTSHTYREEVAEQLFSKLNTYIIQLKKVLERLRK
ncbi:nucleotidyltransferase substrate binding protein, HI0074 family [Balnearium lithotrophicum]|uniref:Nucleotidyltransferase substrate binding protein, HI0074 family n=1 Tax=Balnearium lithotrophicum TaxID=223788 RepID=A0A521C8G9_9BACT|nr:HI0074 family nucleotidyltransferase substrate-binding subunit [Balnearium lithotrophicum]SMO55739.1 nucleotidyltransferase substrate binding protein, HI0074 family [Balnearium lithotrophicum]